MRGLPQRQRRHQVVSFFATISIVTIYCSVVIHKLSPPIVSSPSSKAEDATNPSQHKYAPTGSNSTTTTFPVFPIEYWERRQELLSSSGGAYDQVKVLHVVRHVHAQGVHNINKNYRDEIFLDARLTEFGRQQSEKLAQKVLNLSIDLIVTSPMTRCIQTLMYSFPHVLGQRQLLLSSSSAMSIPFIAHEALREAVNFKCDQRRSISELEAEFGDRLDFSVCPIDEDLIWNEYETRYGRNYQDHRESAELHRLAERGRQFFYWLQGRPEQHVVIGSHSAFLRCITNWGHPGGVPKQPPQRLNRSKQDKEEWSKLHPPVLHYRRGNNESEEFEKWMRSKYGNAEMRSFVIAFPSSSTYVA